ncbi:hypothetical protein EMIT093MI4_110205 [Pseudomonas sp. IT-93MI4]
MGASLLAKAACQSTSWLNDTPPSRVGSLPHLIYVHPGGFLPLIFRVPNGRKSGDGRWI